jgi:hypothetical protein
MGDAGREAASALRAQPLTAETGVTDSDISNLAHCTVPSVDPVLNGTAVP